MVVEESHGKERPPSALGCRWSADAFGWACLVPTDAFANRAICPGTSAPATRRKRPRCSSPPGASRARKSARRAERRPAARTRSAAARAHSAGQPNRAPTGIRIGAGCFWARPPASSRRQSSWRSTTPPGRARAAGPGLALVDANDRARPGAGALEPGRVRPGGPVSRPERRLGWRAPGRWPGRRAEAVGWRFRGQPERRQLALGVGLAAQALRSLGRRTCGCRSLSQAGLAGTASICATRLTAGSPRHRAHRGRWIGFFVWP